MENSKATSGRHQIESYVLRSQAMLHPARLRSTSETYVGSFLHIDRRTSSSHVQGTYADRASSLIERTSRQVQLGHGNSIRLGLTLFSMFQNLHDAATQRVQRKSLTSIGSNPKQANMKSVQFTEPRKQKDNQDIKDEFLDVCMSHTFADPSTTVHMHSSWMYSGGATTDRSPTSRFNAGVVYPISESIVLEPSLPSKCILTTQSFQNPKNQSKS